MLEVCIDSLESAVNAVHGGADELEVCSSLPEGGLTPSAGLVDRIVQMVYTISSEPSQTRLFKTIHKTCEKCSCKYLSKRPKVNVMIRCRTGSDFCYNDKEMDTMLADITIFKKLKVDRFVFGALLDSREIDEDNCHKVIQQAYPVPVTFHRAFDICVHPEQAVGTIKKIGFSRILTSGQRPSAVDDDAVLLIKALILMHGHEIEIMPGAGVTVDNVKTFLDLGCKIVHSSCKTLRRLPKSHNNLNMGTSDSEALYITDENIVRNIKEVINSCRNVH